MSAPSHLVLLLCAQNLAAWFIPHPSQPPVRLPIEGERLLPVADAEAWIDALHALRARLKDEGHAIGALHLLVDGPGRTVAKEALARLLATLFAPADEPPWQLLAWEFLARLHDLPLASPWSEEARIENALIPWLVHRNVAETLAHEAQRLAEEKQRLVTAFDADRARLRAEIERLRSQRDALRQLDCERMATFLPALYEAFFHHVSPQDLALLCGRLEPPRIPNPWPEPTPEVLRKLQKDFRALPPEVQREIIAFAKQIPAASALRVRSEMRDLFESHEG